MYLLTIKDGLVTRHVGPYPSPKQASDDLDRVLSSCSDRARWQIHALECPGDVPFGQVKADEQRSVAAIAS